MSSFVPFSASLAKQAAISPASIIGEGKIAVQTDVTGYFVERIVAQATRIKTVLKDLMDTIPLIATGPQPSLEVNYNKISYLSGVITAAVDEIDKKMPPELQSGVFLSNAFTALKTFPPYLSHLGSSSAPTYQSFIPKFEETFSAVIHNFDEIIANQNKIEEKLIASTPKISGSERPYAYLAAAILCTIEQCIIDIDFLLAEPQLVANEEKYQEISQFTAILDQFSHQVFSAALQDQMLLVATTAIINKHPISLLGIVESIQSILPNMQAVSSLSLHAVQLMGLINRLSTAEMSRCVRDTCANIAPALIGKQKLDPISANVKAFLSTVTERISYSSFHSTHPALLNFHNAIVGYSKVDESKEPHKFAARMIAICRLYSLTVPDYSSTISILNVIYSQTSQILKSLVNDGKALSKEIMDLFNSSLNSFNEKSLGELNYQTLAIRQVSIVDDQSPTFLSSIFRFYGSLSRLAYILPAVIKTCTNPGLKDKLEKLLPTAASLSFATTVWIYQMLMTITAFLHSKAESLLALTAFINATLPKAVDRLGDVVASFQITFQVSPTCMYSDITESLKLNDKMNEISTFFDDIKSAVGNQSAHPLYPVLSIATDCFTDLSKPLPGVISQLSGFSKFDDIDNFVSVVGGLLQETNSLVTSSKDIFNKSKEAFTLYFGITSMYSLIICSMLQNSPKFASTLMHFTSSVRAPLDVMWPMIAQLLEGSSSSDAANLPMFTSSLAKQLGDMLNTINGMNQPIAEVSIPEELRDLKRFETIIGNIANPSIQKVGTEIVNVIKDKLTDQSRAAVRIWLDAAQLPPQDIQTACSSMKELAEEFLTEIGEKAAFMQRLATLSIAIIAYSENSPQEEYLPFIKDRRKAIFDLFEQMIQSDITKALLFRLLSTCIMITTIDNLSNFKAKDFASRQTDLIMHIIINVQNIRNTQGSIPTELLLSAITYMTRFQVLLFIGSVLKQPINKYDHAALEPALQALIDGTAKKATYDKVIQYFASRLSSLVPSNFELIGKEKDPLIICDHIYDQSEIYRESANEVFLQQKAHSISISDLADYLEKMTVATGESLALGLYALDIEKLTKSPAIMVFIESFCRAFRALNHFTREASEMWTSDKSQDEISQSLRLLNRQAAKEFDTIINFIENPPRSEENKSDFDKLKFEVLDKLARLLVHIGALDSAASRALVPEMYDASRDKLAKAIPIAQDELAKSVQALTAKAVGPTAEDVKKLCDSLYPKFQNIITESGKVTFTSALTTITMLAETESICNKVLPILHMMDTIVDRIKINPDPISADQIPTDFVMPPIPEHAPSPADAFADLEKAVKSHSAATAKFIKVIDEEYATSLDLVDAIEAYQKESIAFTKIAQVMAVATVDSRLQVELQTAIHSFSGAIVSIYNAMKSRLLRSDNFAKEMKEALQTVKDSTSAVVEKGEQSSKFVEVVEEEPDEETDEVTRELMETARQIEEMSARLAKFQTQIQVDAPEEEEIEEDIDEAEDDNPPPPAEPEEGAAGVAIDIQAEKDTLPGYVITHATPILSTTTQILGRAKEITQQLIQALGRLENEKLMIKCAQDLSEAAELLLICAEILIKGEDELAEFKLIAASRIIKASIASLVAQILVKGGDSEGIMNKHVKTVQRHVNKIIKKAEVIVKQRFDEMANKGPKARNATIMKLNMQSKINDAQKQLQDEEFELNKFRRRK